MVINVEEVKNFIQGQKKRKEKDRYNKVWKAFEKYTKDANTNATTENLKKFVIDFCKSTLIEKINNVGYNQFTKKEIGNISRETARSISLLNDINDKVIGEEKLFDGLFIITNKGISFTNGIVKNKLIEIMSELNEHNLDLSTSDIEIINNYSSNEQNIVSFFDDELEEYFSDKNSSEKSYVYSFLNYISPERVKAREILARNPKAFVDYNSDIETLKNVKTNDVYNVCRKIIWDKIKDNDLNELNRTNIIKRMELILLNTSKVYSDKLKNINNPIAGLKVKYNFEQFKQLYNYIYDLAISDLPKFVTEMESNEKTVNVIQDMPIVGEEDNISVNDFFSDGTLSDVSDVTLSDVEYDINNSGPREVEGRTEDNVSENVFSEEEGYTSENDLGEDSVISDEEDYTSENDLWEGSVISDEGGYTSENDLWEGSVISEEEDNVSENDLWEGSVISDEGGYTSENDLWEGSVISDEEDNVSENELCEDSVISEEGGYTSENDLGEDSVVSEEDNVSENDLFSDGTLSDVSDVTLSDVEYDINNSGPREVEGRTEDNVSENVFSEEGGYTSENDLSEESFISDEEDNVSENELCEDSVISDEGGYTSENDLGEDSVISDEEDNVSENDLSEESFISVGSFVSDRSAVSDGSITSVGSFVSDRSADSDGSVVSQYASTASDDYAIWGDFGEYVYYNNIDQFRVNKRIDSEKNMDEPASKKMRLNSTFGLK